MKGGETTWNLFITTIQGSSFIVRECKIFHRLRVHTPQNPKKDNNIIIDWYIVEWKGIEKADGK